MQRRNESDDMRKSIAGESRAFAVPNEQTLGEHHFIERHEPARIQAKVLMLGSEVVHAL